MDDFERGRAEGIDEVKRAVRTALWRHHFEFADCYVPNPQPIMVVRTRTIVEVLDQFGAEEPL